MAKNATVGTKESARTYLSQSDVPSYSLEKALRIPSAIRDNYGYKPTSPLQLARALEIAPTSSTFRMLTGAAIAYGLTNGGYNAETISIAPLGLRIIKPTMEGDDLVAKREALLKPRVIREFLEKYNGAPLPKDSIAQNVLNDMGVPLDRTEEVMNLILEGAEAVGFLHTIKDRKYVEISSGVSHSDTAEGQQEQSEAGDYRELPEGGAVIQIPLRVPQPAPPAQSLSSPDTRFKRVFITHGKNKGFIEPIKKLLAFGELDAVVAAEKQTVSQPVPEKVMEDMRSCGAAIIHVEGERRLMDNEAKEHVVLNENVLIEIGGAMALYGRRFILVVKDGVQLPSNLQGLYEVRYTGETLDGDATIKLMEAINDMKKRPLP
jgi:Predicted nucleotide-binding protein containing TIR-like domain